MNRTILSKIKLAIRLNLEDKASQIIESHGTYLSKRNLRDLITYMDKIRTYNTNNIEIIRLLMWDDRVDPSADNNKAIRNAVKYGPHRSSRVKHLLTDDRILRPAVRNGLDRAIIEARWQGLTEIVELLINAIRNFEKRDSI